ncbi:hypothetical protein Anapl_04066 [Anas platyrhynchos]|uniref:Uncharacterized protein n=1 Tax=Anas platyrhynchos TaxID=8839 RepID=R0K0L8_ANAPL|nr:hypothetical protein Anapl_04066 [Anas platyrhynchos]
MIPGCLLLVGLLRMWSPYSNYLVHWLAPDLLVDLTPPELTFGSLFLLHSLAMCCSFWMPTAGIQLLNLYPLSHILKLCVNSICYQHGITLAAEQHPAKELALSSLRILPICMQIHLTPLALVELARVSVRAQSHPSIWAQAAPSVYSSDGTSVKQEQDSHTGERGRLQVLGSAWGHRAWCREWEPRIARVPVTLLGSPHHLRSSPPRLLGLQPPIQLAGCDTPVGPPLGSRGSSEQHFAGARGPAAAGSVAAGEVMWPPEFVANLQSSERSDETSCCTLERGFLWLVFFKVVMSITIMSIGKGLTVHASRYVLLKIPGEERSPEKERNREQLLSDTTGHPLSMCASLEAALKESCCFPSQQERMFLPFPAFILLRVKQLSPVAFRMAGGKYFLLTARRALEDEGFVPMPAACSDLHLDLEQMADIASITYASRSCTDTDLTLCIVFQPEHLY